MAIFDGSKASYPLNNTNTANTPSTESKNDKIKVMIADHSSALRRLLADVIAKHDEIELSYEAKNGSEALGALPKCSPDVVVLEVEMPVMNGLETAAAIRALNPKVPIIMFSALMREGAEMTIKALARGASDFQTKPKLIGHLSKARQHIVENLIPKIIRWGRRKSHAPNLAGTAPKSQPQLKKPTGLGQKLGARTEIPRPDVIAIGASTGGPKALKEFLKPLPGDLEVPILIVQHMPPIFTSTMASQLNSGCQLNVVEATEGMEIQPGFAYVAPGDFHMTVAKKRSSSVLKLDQNEKVHFCRPAVDVLFRSLPSVFGPRILALVLTGMGKDGLDGAKAIHRNGGTIMSQDHESSSVWGMPAEIYQAKIAKQVLPPNRLAQETIRLIRQPATG